MLLGIEDGTGKIIINVIPKKDFPLARMLSKDSWGSITILYQEFDIEYLK